MKTATLAVLIMATLATFRRQNSTTIYERRIDDSIVRTASTLLIMYFSLFVFSSMAISSIEGLPILECMFESASAVGTVGLTLGLTPTLSLPSRAIIIVLMFLGRVGGLTMIFAAVKNNANIAKFPMEKITVG